MQGTLRKQTTKIYSRSTLRPNSTVTRRVGRSSLWVSQPDTQFHHPISYTHHAVTRYDTHTHTIQLPDIIHTPYHTHTTCHHPIRYTPCRYSSSYTHNTVTLYHKHKPYCHPISYTHTPCHRLNYSQLFVPTPPSHSPLKHELESHAQLDVVCSCLPPI